MLAALVYVGSCRDGFMNKRIGQHAAVVGGGFAGLCIARVLSEHFQRVTVVERDVLPDQKAHRPGVPQSHHVHALLLRGLSELELLFPGIENDLSAEGARRMDMGEEFAHFTEWGWSERAHLGVAPLTVSRLLIESVIRRRVKALSAKVHFLEGTRVTGLVSERTPRGVRVVGVETSRPEQRVLLCDLVVDASGRGTKSPEWLAAIGVERAREDLVESFSGYASRFYELAPDANRWWRGMLIDAAPPDVRRWGLLMPAENNRWVLTLAGTNRDYPPSDEEGFLRYLGTLRSKTLAQEIARAKPVSDIHSHRALVNRARRYDLWGQEVSGFIATGDSACAFNAAHGQGMSMAAWCANTLGSTIRKVGVEADVLPRAFHRAQWKVLSRAWDLATGIDLQWPETEGPRPFAFGVSRWLAVEAARAAHEDPVLKAKLGPVIHLLKSPYSALSPNITGRVLWASLRRRMRPQLAAGSAQNPPQLPSSDTGPHTALT